MTFAASPVSARPAHQPAGLAPALRRKRVFDLTLLGVTSPLTLPLAALIALLVLVLEGRPILYRARRAGQFAGAIDVWKFRTMRPQTCEIGVSGGAKLVRVSRFSTLLRRARLDELPQLINILRGEMSFVGPRPPDLRYVHMFPELYAQVLAIPPGLTGLATLRMHRFEGRVLSHCDTPEETERIYCRRCIPRKARLDLIYLGRLTRPGALRFDIWLLAGSVLSVLNGIARRKRS